VKPEDSLEPLGQSALTRNDPSTDLSKPLQINYFLHVPRREKGWKPLSSHNGVGVKEELVEKKYSSGAEPGELEEQSASGWGGICPSNDFFFPQTQVTSRNRVFSSLFLKNYVKSHILYYSPI